MQKYISIAIQGVVQGLTEFLPVSSSGHLSVLQHFMGVKEENLLITVVLHLGTLLAVFLAFAPLIGGMIREFFLTIRDAVTGKFSWKSMNPDRRMMFMVIIGTAMLIPVFPVKNFFTAPSEDNDIIFEGIAFLYTSLLLILSDRCKKGEKTGKDMKVKDAVTVGIFQIFSLFPGVSRSGSTIVSGRFCGLARETAVAFSFILGIPAILGGSVFELGDVIRSGEKPEWSVLAAGFVISAAVGFFTIKLVRFIAANDKFKIFGIYTLVLGILCIGEGIYENVAGHTIFAAISQV
jgi:undecaprenyl-diphosphatase